MKSILCAFAILIMGFSFAQAAPTKIVKFSVKFYDLNEADKAQNKVVCNVEVTTPVLIDNCTGGMSESAKCILNIRGAPYCAEVSVLPCEGNISSDPRIKKGYNTFLEVHPNGVCHGSSNEAVEFNQTGLDSSSTKVFKQYINTSPKRSAGFPRGPQEDVGAMVTFEE